MSWMPCSGKEMLEDVVWLPRLLSKARRSEAMGGAHRFDGYLYGDNDYVDAQVLEFLRTNDAAVSDLVRSLPDDSAVAKILVERSGHSPQECRTFSGSLRRKLHNFALMEADEGRMPPGLRRTLIRFAYNALLMPIFYRQFNRAENRR